VSRSVLISLALVFAGCVISLAHPICDFIFHCGCSAIWSGGADTCQLLPGHVPLDSACPLCAARPLVIGAVLGGSWLCGLAGTCVLYARGGPWLSISLGVMLCTACLLAAVWLLGVYEGFPKQEGTVSGAPIGCGGSIERQ